MSKPQKLPSGKWRVRFIDHEGKRKSETFNTEAAARAGLRAREHHVDKVRAGLVAPPAPDAPLFKDFAKTFMETYVAAKNKQSTKVEKERHLRLYLVPILGDKRLTEITTHHITALTAAMMKDGHSPKYIANTLATASKLMHYAKKGRLVSELPDFEKPPAESATDEIEDDKWLTFEALDQLLAAAKADPMLYAQCLLAARAGLRAGEIRALQWSDLNLKTGRVTVRWNEVRGHIGTPKGKKAATISLKPTVLAALKAIRSETMLRGPFVFSDAGGGHLTEKEQHLAIVNLGVRAGMPQALAERERIRLRHNVNRYRKKETMTAAEAAAVAHYESSPPARWGLHILRHTFCSHLAIKGASALQIMRLARHANIATTQKYMHLGPRDQDAALALLADDIASDAPADIADGHDVDTAASVD